MTVFASRRDTVLTHLADAHLATYVGAACHLTQSHRCCHVVGYAAGGQYLSDGKSR